MRKLLTERTLEELRGRIEEEAEFVDVKPYSHNEDFLLCLHGFLLRLIVSLLLSEVTKRFGQESANQAIEDFGLEDLGWSKK